MYGKFWQDAKIHQSILILITGLAVIDTSNLINCCSKFAYNIAELNTLLQNTGYFTNTANRYRDWDILCYQPVNLCIMFFQRVSSVELRLLHGTVKVNRARGPLGPLCSIHWQCLWGPLGPLVKWNHDMVWWGHWICWVYCVKLCD